MMTDDYETYALDALDALESAKLAYKTFRELAAARAQDGAWAAAAMPTHDPATRTAVGARHGAR